jgi:two-component sensor histidine kinase/DNA-binding response OmpR family regulator
MVANSKVNVLLVDDQPGKLLSYEVILGELGENLIKTASAKEALEVLLKTEVAVVLIDVCMPDLDGFELARMIRDHPRFQRTAIIFISAIHVSEADSLRGYDVGAVDYVPVPVVPEVLRAKVRVFAELYRKTRELEALNNELEQRVAERTTALREIEQSRTLALAAGNMGSWELNVRTGRWTVDEGQYRIFGIDPRTQTPADGVASLFHPDDWANLQRLLYSATPTSRTFQTEVRIVRESGEIRWCLVAAAVTLDAHDNPERISGVTIDITDRKEAEHKQSLLAREVDHRARNALAVVQAIIRLGKATTIEDYIGSVEGRVRALATSHELLSQSRWQGADIARLVTEEFAPYQTDGECRAAWEGPAIILPADKAQTIALMIHELATNAAKYGALSVPAGRVHLSWDLQDGRFLLAWRESGGPAPSKPQSKGFGTRIIEASLNRSKGDIAEFDWRPEGLLCRIAISIVSQHEEANVSQTNTLPPQTKAPQILVVEDEALVGMLTSELVNQMGCEVVGPCVELREAMTVTLNKHIDGAILDVNLGGEMIFPLARVLRDKKIPIVFLTGYAKSIVEEGFAECVVLQKPAPADELQKALATLIDPNDRPKQVTN